MAFPAHQLRVKSGYIHGYLFENASIRLPLHLSWALQVKFAPIWHEGEEFECSLSVEWLNIPVTDWRDIARRSILSTDQEVLATFFMCEHESAQKTELRIGDRYGTSFDVDWTSWIDFYGWTEEDRDPSLCVQVRTKLPFVGIGVHHQLLAGQNDPSGHAETLLARFVDRDRFGSIEFLERQGIEDRYFLLPE